jgi:hypothetical protein
MNIDLINPGLLLVATILSAGLSRLDHGQIGTVHLTETVWFRAAVADSTRT